MKILFLDIETAPEYENYESLPEAGKAAFKRKFERSGELKELMKEPFLKLDMEKALALLYIDKAGLLAEFSKIICICTGIIHDVNQAGAAQNNRVVYMRSFSGDDEVDLLKRFAASFDKYEKSFEGREEVLMCAHNGKMFDFPYLMRRFIKHDLKKIMPSCLEIAGKKPWEVPLVDTMELWRGTDFKGYASLVVIAYCLGIPSPKEDIDGSMVAAEYRTGNLPKIIKYCFGDIKVMIMCWLKIKGLPPIETFSIVEEKPAA